MLPEEIKKYVGQTIDSSVFRVEKEPVRRFADAVGDPNPLYHDEEYARKSRFGAILAPPGFLSSLWFTGRTRAEDIGPTALMQALAAAGHGRVLDTGIDYDFFQPVRVGDTIRSAAVVTNVVERAGVVFVVIETTFTNQNDQTVMKSRSMTAHQ